MPSRPFGLTNLVMSEGSNEKKDLVSRKMRESRPPSLSLPHFQLVQTVRTHGSGPCDRGSSARLEATDNLGRRTAPLVIFAPRMGHRSAARRRLEPEMPNEQSEEPRQEPVQNPGAEPPAEAEWRNENVPPFNPKVDYSRNKMSNYGRLKKSRRLFEREHRRQRE